MEKRNSEQAGFHHCPPPHAIHLSVLVRMISDRSRAQIQRTLSKKTPGRSDTPQNFHTGIRTKKGHSEFVELTLKMYLPHLEKLVHQRLRRTGVPEMPQTLPKHHKHRDFSACGLRASHRLRIRTNATWCKACSSSGVSVCAFVPVKQVN